MSVYLSAVFVLLKCLLKFVISAYLYDDCWTVWYLPTHFMFSYLYNVCLTLWCLLNCMMSAQLNDVLFVPCPRTRLTYVQLYYVCLPVRCFSYLDDVCLPVGRFPASMVSAYLYHVCSTAWCLPSCMLSTQMYYDCLPVWFLPNCMMSALLYNVCLPV
jgi:hypothetical protein